MNRVVYVAKGLLKWAIADIFLFWCSLIVTILPMVAFFFYPSEKSIRLWGLFLQECGVGTVIWGVWNTRKLFGRPSFVARIPMWWQRRPTFRNQTITVRSAGSQATVG